MIIFIYTGYMEYQREYFRYSKVPPTITFIGQANTELQITTKREHLTYDELKEITQSSKSMLDSHLTSLSTLQNIEHAIFKQ